MHPRSLSEVRRNYRQIQNAVVRHVIFQCFPQLEYKGILYRNIAYKLLQPHFKVSHHYKLL